MSKFGTAIALGLPKFQAWPKQKPEVDLRRYGRHLVKSTRRHNSVADLPKPFPRSIFAHSATVPSYNMALVSIKLINPSYFVLVCPHPGWLCYYCNVSYLLSYVTYSVVFYYALLCFYHCILRTDVLIYSASQLQEGLINLLTYVILIRDKQNISK